MLTADQATEQLRSYCSCTEGVKRPVSVKGLTAPRLARRIADNMNDKSGTHDVAARAIVQATSRSLADEFDALDRRAAAKVLTALCPKVGAELAFWWDWSRSRPYLHGWWGAQPFRSVDHEFTRASRWDRLRSLIEHFTHYPQPMAWHATWLLHLSEYTRLGDVLASAVDAGDTEVRGILIECLTGAPAIGGPSAHAYVALLASADPAAWDVVVDQLRDAGRAEGLRTTILTALSHAHPDAIARVLGVVVDEGLVRFSSTVRMASGIVDEELTVRDAGAVGTALQTIVTYLRTPPSAADLRARGRVEAYLGLWTLSVRDIAGAVDVATALLRDGEAGHRLAAARMLVRLWHPSTAAPLALALDDDDLAVFAAALQAWPVSNGTAARDLPLTPGAVIALRRRRRELTATREIDTGILTRHPESVKAADIVDVISVYANDDEVDLSDASPDVRRATAGRYAKDPVLHRAPLFALLFDSSWHVRDAARRGFDVDRITTEEAIELEKALTRKAQDLRKIAIRLLQLQDAEGVAASVERLRAGAAAQRRAAEDIAEAAGLTETPAVAADTSASLDDESVDDGPFADRPELLRFGVEERTPSVRPSAPAQSRWDQYHPGARRIWLSFEAWMAEHAGVEVQSTSGVQLLENVSSHQLRTSDDGTIPLAELVDPWWERVRGELVDGGVELALLDVLGAGQYGIGLRVLGDIGREGSDTQSSLRSTLLGHLARRERRASWAEPVIDLLALAAAELPMSDLLTPRTVKFSEGLRLAADWDPRERSVFDSSLAYLDPATLDDEQLRRLWSILRFIDEPEGAVDQWSGPKVEWADPFYRGETVLSVDQPFRFRPPLAIVRAAFERGVASRADLIDWAFTRPALRNEPHGTVDNPLAAFSALTDAAPETQAVVEAVQRTVVELELPRGDVATAYTTMAATLSRATGAQTLVATLRALGRRPIMRRYVNLRWSDREASFAHLLRVHHPAPDESGETLAEALAGSKIPESRVIETAVYAPQWAEVVEQHLGWTGFASAVWWLHAHTQRDSWELGHTIRDERAREIAKRTPVSTDDRERGCADAEWFHRMRAELGDERLDRVLKAAKYASVSGEHKQAELFAQALRGHVGEDELLTRMHEKRHQDAVRAYALLPLPEGDADVLHRRYEVLRAFVSTGKANGPQRRAAETTAVHTALENLARNAGYRDPQRLIWAMEARTAADLAEGAVTAVDGDLTVSLSIDDLGMPVIAVDRAGKTLAAVPAKSRKVEAIAALIARSKELGKQAQRMRASLEAACVLGDVFEPGEIALLRAHPLLGRMLADLVLVDTEGRAGFLATSGDELVRADGTPVAPVGGLRIAHPVDLLASGDWPDLQHEVMTRGRPQPFKQVFRELYVPTENERGEGGISSRRYVGHQVAARRASGLFIARNWVREYGRGFERTFHNEKIHVFCNVEEGWGTAAEVEDATIDDVRFGVVGSWRAIPLEEVPPRVYSETMRDLDLVVSVGHSSGVDPQSSESTVEVRRRIVDETCLMLGIDNVEVDGHHVRVKGAIGTYSVHLGSGIVHRIPGNTLFIIPVGAQHRGRIFLPFVDDDPRTAEIVSKVVMLAADDKIKDPTILSQLVR
ncbi:DUF5724 domain-containing protein [Microbacterium sp. NPDC089695]|uniref:DUF5724 domain-containing protein n=1 Tax=Microbacterium sp. NPDC089695 TaxID=3364198 RepID=UPI00382F2703